jgi:hypothetical protein
VRVYTAEADVAISTGRPLYLTGAGHLLLAQADAVGSAGVAGLAYRGAEAHVTAEYISEGQVTRSDWSPITGTAALVAGANYFLSPSVGGQLTPIAPTAAGQFVVRVGRAVSTLVLDIEIAPPIRL